MAGDDIVEPRGKPVVNRTIGQLGNVSILVEIDAVRIAKITPSVAGIDGRIRNAGKCMDHGGVREMVVDHLAAEGSTEKLDLSVHDPVAAAICFF
jgi:hypothetical protein